MLQDQAHAISYIANISEAVARLLKPYGIGFVHRPAGTLRSRLMRVKDQIDLSEQSLIIYRVQCKDYSSNYTGQTSRMVGTRLKEHRLAIRNCNVKASPMASHCVETGHVFALGKTKFPAKPISGQRAYSYKLGSQIKIQ